MKPYMAIALASAVGLSSLAWLLAPSGTSQLPTGSLTTVCPIFSGRDNPEGTIQDPALIEVLRAMLQDLPPVPPPAWPELGGRGLMFFNRGVPDFPEVVRVQDGVVRTYGDGGIQHFEDAKGIERLAMVAPGPAEHVPLICQTFRVDVTSTSPCGEAATLITLQGSATTLYLEDRAGFGTDVVDHWLYVETNGQRGLQRGGVALVNLDPALVSEDPCPDPGVPDTLVL